MSSTISNQWHFESSRGHSGLEVFCFYEAGRGGEGVQLRHSETTAASSGISWSQLV